MENRRFTVSSPKNQAIHMHVINGHFTTNNSHISHYIDMSGLKFHTRAARNVARELAAPYLAGAAADTIVCMDGTEVIAAYLAEELLRRGTPDEGGEGNIFVVTPKSNVNGQLIFHQSAQDMIQNRNIILLVASASSGKTICRALDCLAYYGGEPAGISALFSTKSEINGQAIHALFTDGDIPDYKFFNPAECAFCGKGRKLDAIVNSEGYTKI
jgi:orotate phosphoribosyltransferase